ncbi:MAG: Hsp20/alpha crystallin family protein [Bacteroidetes bacterium]|nr:Hsp20/alpha crystallin family protein [Bacteroidota bacterium]MBV6460959.1 Acid shock protein [Flavobacteriales bacterium]WKZ75642.1 MAG: Hsp20/alpha crystallin family protein [Vicingaceae bacterium]MCL4815208.1 Hsp20/alpha crystallin family protein [Flavobacteriales bacterium]NOG94550.1 Hsp20/alpha crystallin family protein [Bacteroidota bacterium]
MSTLVKKTNEFFPSFIGNVFDDMWNFDRLEKTSSFLPAVNISETDKSFNLEVSAPGFKKDDFKVSVEENVLSVSGEYKSENEEKNKNYTRKEFRSGSFKRQFTLPDTINLDEINATYNDGILKVELPKVDAAKLKPIKEVRVS